jgi:hypothetical protein
MRVADFIKALGEHKPMHATRDYSVPKGWSTIEQIREELGLAHTRNASSRARELWGRGLLERIAHQFKANTGQCHMSYVYRVKKPWRSFAHAANNIAHAVAEKVPKGWVRIMDYCQSVHLSHVALRARIARANIKPKYYKTCRGVSGLHLNAYYRKADLDRLLRRR